MFCRQAYFLSFDTLQNSLPAAIRSDDINSNVKCKFCYTFNTNAVYAAQWYIKNTSKRNRRNIEESYFYSSPIRSLPITIYS